MRALLTAGLALAAAVPNAHALNTTLVGSGFSEPVALASPAGDSRLFIVEKAGRIQLLDNGARSTYLDISAQVDTDGERGLLGLAFDPNFAANGRFYVNYIDKATKNTVVAAYTAPSAASNTADAASAKTIISIAQPAGLSNHKAGWIGFRPGDGNNLYIATGDGGGGNDPNNNAQNLSSNLGKMLRITPQANGGYTIPASNPFVGVAGNDEIWAYGLRNPYRNSFDRATGDFYIADVGQGLREELDFEAAGTAGGRNNGWPSRPRARPAGATPAGARAKARSTTPPWATPRRPTPSTRSTTTPTAPWAAPSSAATSTAAPARRGWTAPTSSATSTPARSFRCARAVARPAASSTARPNWARPSAASRSAPSAKTPPATCT